MKGAKRIATATRREAQEGAAIIEALGLLGILAGIIVLVLFIGSSFYNLAVLNTTAQTATLSGQAIMDRYCSPGLTTNCSMAENKAADVTRQIMANTEKQLMFVQPGSLQATGAERDPSRPLSILRTGSSSVVPTPSPTGGFGGTTLPAGWGYTYTRMQVQMSMWGNSSGPTKDLKGAYTIAAQSITPSYKEPN